MQHGVKNQRPLNDLITVFSKQDSSINRIITRLLMRFFDN